MAQNSLSLRLLLSSIAKEQDSQGKIMAFSSGDTHKQSNTEGKKLPSVIQHVF